jgi:hypothetical protein
MQDRHHHTTGRLGDPPLDRLLRDLTAFGASEPGRPPADERLAAELGDDLLAALHAELDRLDFGGFPLCKRARRVA